jgi:hypothetical protein
MIVCDGICLEPQAVALTASELLGLAPHRALFSIRGSCDEELTIGFHLPQRYSRILCAVPGNENSLACSCQVETNCSKDGSLCVIDTYRCPSHWETVSTVLFSMLRKQCASALTLDFLFWQAVQALLISVRFGFPPRGRLGDL